MSLRDDRITITVETPEMPNNDAVAARALLIVLAALRDDGIYPSRVTLDVTATPPTAWA